MRAATSEIRIQMECDFGEGVRLVSVPERLVAVRCRRVGDHLGPQFLLGESEPVAVVAC